MNKEEKQAKQRYVQMFYNLEYRNLVCFYTRQIGPNQLHKKIHYISYKIKSSNMNLLQVNSVPIPTQEVPKPVPKPTVRPLHPKRHAVTLHV